MAVYLRKFSDTFNFGFVWEFTDGGQVYFQCSGPSERRLVTMIGGKHVGLSVHDKFLFGADKKVLDLMVTCAYTKWKLKIIKRNE